jgi:selenide,water dikinase
MEEVKKLTSFSKASGCGCKLPPALLHQILDGFTTGHGYPQLLVGNDKADDASVFQINDHTALIQTVDFFTPIVNDPFSFGCIGAANAIGDIYAMGGKPLMANVILGFPADALEVGEVQAILRGASAVCAQAGIPMAGGHSVNISELIFGLSVTGTANPANIKTNAGARDGDVLLLTKPLGTGILGAAIKRGLSNADEEKYLADHCSKLNSVGEALGNIDGVHAMTDVTGFGFYGHLLEMCKGSGLSATIHFDKLPLIDIAKPYASKFVLPDNTFRNSNTVKDFVRTGVKDAFAWLNDPQTNGGLLVAIDPAHLADVEDVLNRYGLASFSDPIGKLHFTEDGISMNVI